MDAMTIPAPNRELQAAVQQVLDHWVNPCFSHPYEHISAIANDLGEVWLSGLVDASYNVEEAIWLVKRTPSVRVVYNLVTIMCHYHAVTA